MKFTQVPLGQRFSYQGETLVKVGPMTASNERGGNLRLIPRSAMVAILSEAPQPAATETALDPSRVEGALARCEARWKAAVAALDPAERKPLEAELASAQSELRAALGLEPTIAASP